MEPTRPATSASAAERALRQDLGAEGLERLATAQARIAWSELMAELGFTEFGTARLVHLRGGIASVEATDPMLGQELSLRRDRLLQQLNQRMRGRPAARPVLELRVSVNRRAR